MLLWIIESTVVASAEVLLEDPILQDTVLPNLLLVANEWEWARIPCWTPPMDYTHNPLPPDPEAFLDAQA